MPRPANDSRHPYGSFPTTGKLSSERTRIRLPAVLDADAGHGFGTIVAGKDHDSIVGYTRLIDRIDNLSGIVVDLGEGVLVVTVTCVWRNTNSPMITEG
jgi:hypothetical protein